MNKPVLFALLLCLVLPATVGAEDSGPPSKGRPSTVLIITADDLAQDWFPFARWKTRLGKSAEIVTLGEIEKTFEGPDIQAKIRACCLDRIANHGCRWVVLGGDSEPGGKGLVPDRDTPHRCMSINYGDIPTDAYYISDTDWDADDDGVYGEFDQDRDAVAYASDRACIGRIPVRSADDVAAYTNKVMDYETSYPGGEFARTLVQTCPERGAYPKLTTSMGVIARAWTQGRVLQFFAHKTPWDSEASGDHALSPENWMKMINDRTAGKIHMHGHGFLPVWVLEGHERINARHVGKLTNENAYLTMTTVSCFTGHFDAKADPSITESMLRKAEGGAVLIVAPAREGVPAFHDPRVDFRLMVMRGKMDGTTHTLTRFWRGALCERLTAGEALNAAKAAQTADAKKTASYHYVQCELNLLGDPTLDLRAKEPMTPKMELPSSLSTKKRTLILATDAPGATVCIWKGDEVYEVVKTDEEGNATLPLACKTPGRLLVSVSGPSLNAVVGEIEVK